MAISAQIPIKNLRIPAGGSLVIEAGASITGVREPTTVSSGAISDLTSGQQAVIIEGAIVTTTDGKRWVYSGSGSKTSEASYIQLADVTPAWESIPDKPTTFPPNLHTFGITVDGAGTVLTAGSKGFVTIPYDCTITDWFLAADQAGNVVIDVLLGGTSIVGTGNPPTLSTAQSGNAAVSGWTSVAVTAGDILEFAVTGTPATITRVNLVIKAS